MPLVSSFFGIRIFMYWDEHLPEHFHAEYGNFKALVGIREAAVFRGTLPARQLKFRFFNPGENSKMAKAYNLVRLDFTRIKGRQLCTSAK